MLAQINGFFGIVERMDRSIPAASSRCTRRCRPCSEVALRLRDDVVTEGDERERNQRSAPQVEDGLYLVPRVIDEVDTRMSPPRLTKPWRCPASASTVAARSAAYSLPKPPKSSSMPARGRRCGASLPAPPATSRSAAAAPASAPARAGAPARKSQARRSTPEVMSNRPSLSACSLPAKSSSAAVSASTSTASPPPAAALMRDTMLSSR